LGDKALVGVGSVLDPEQCHQAIDAGAQFVVTPAVRPQVISASLNRSIPVLAGGLTPTELLQAHELGCELIKLFPAQLGGPRYLKDVLAPLPFLKLVPTGGISPENAREYLAAGAVALGIGGNMISKQAVAAKNFDLITQAAKATVIANRSFFLWANEKRLRNSEAFFVTLYALAIGMAAISRHDLAHWRQTSAQYFICSSTFPLLTGAGPECLDMGAPEPSAIDV
jgi:2-dehydro-3-deoxyphosphogluconate aldolase/(4S)-4-hydroxy-2-oxoglutarate aldolase